MRHVLQYQNYQQVYYTLRICLMVLLVLWFGPNRTTLVLSDHLQMDSGAVHFSVNADRLSMDQRRVESKGENDTSSVCLGKKNRAKRDSEEQESWSMKMSAGWLWFGEEQQTLIHYPESEEQQPKLAAFLPLWITVPEMSFSPNSWECFVWEQTEPNHSWSLHRSVPEKRKVERCRSADLIWL